MLRRRAAPKKVTLSDSKIFYARHERISHRQLPRNITVKRKRTIDSRRQKQQSGRGIMGGLSNTESKFG